jgi:hypothetical protein
VRDSGALCCALVAPTAMRGWACTSEAIVSRQSLVTWVPP